MDTHTHRPTTGHNMRVHVTHSPTPRDTPDTHLTTVHILHPHPYGNSLPPTPHRLYRRDHPRQDSLTQDGFTQAKGPFRPSPDFRAHILHLRCGEHTPALTHPRAHYIHPNTYTQTHSPPVSSNTPRWAPHPPQLLFLARAEEGPCLRVPASRMGSGASPRGEGVGVPETSSLPLFPPPSTPPQVPDTAAALQAPPGHLVNRQAGLGA